MDICSLLFPRGDFPHLFTKKVAGLFWKQGLLLSLSSTRRTRPPVSLRGLLEVYDCVSEAAPQEQVEACNSWILTTRIPEK